VKQVFIAPMVRSGGSLITRLFETVDECFSYPFELVFSPARESPEMIKKFGQKYTVQDYVGVSSGGDFDAVLARWGISRLQENCKFGKNFTGKHAGGKAKGLEIKCEWSHTSFLKILYQVWELNQSLDINDLHLAMFKTLEPSEMVLPEVVSFHSGNGSTVDPGSYFSNVKNFMLIPIRDPLSYIASEKMKYYRQRFELFRLEKMGRIPSKVFSKFEFSDTEKSYLQWEYFYLRALILKKYFPAQIYLYYHNDLIVSPEKTLNGIAEGLGVSGFDSRLGPTILGEPWAGNSQFKKTNGIDQTLDSEHKILSIRELSFIEGRLNLLYTNKPNLMNSELDPKIFLHPTYLELNRIFSPYDRRADVLYSCAFLNREKYKSIFR